jgi:hypothetical protein
MWASQRHTLWTVNPTTQAALLVLNPLLTAGGILVAIGVFKGSVGTKLKEHDRRLGEHDGQIDGLRENVGEIRGELNLKLGVSR